MSDKRISSVRLIWLEAFVEVARNRSYKKAGETLLLHPTVIKRYLVSLEKWLYTRLHYKVEGKIHLTDGGDVFLSRAETIIDIMYQSRMIRISDDPRENMENAFKFIDNEEPWRIR